MSDDSFNGSHVSVASLIEALPDALLVADTDGVIFLVNAQAEWLFGRPRSELIGSIIEELMPERFRDRHKKHRLDYNIEPMARPMGFGTNLYVRQKSGNEIVVDISISPLMTGRGMFILAILRRRLNKPKPELLAADN